ncbi:hypothetical protein RQP53_03520 [Paucibacter sp. APW11]|uniref:N-acetyltransferase domain-containing protein n=1 Tax=Roseateles aquae TaxID=3077235 RepID=A0ABU3P709_9BURK|nr:hypothetical protein [Paucibacter sp. APW11]MDT8998342.1 hypothetical protein [Paucibacter sp. APW11]
MGLLSFIRRGRQSSATASSASTIAFRDFTPASFDWSGRNHALQFNVQLAWVKHKGERASVTLKVIDHGIQIESVLDGTETEAVLYLGNYFIVPAQLRRCGLASAVLMACIETFQIAAFGRALPAQRLWLEGLFMGDGARFSSAMCDGVQPTKEAPAAINLRKLASAAGSLSLLSPPVEVQKRVLPSDTRFG